LTKLGLGPRVPRPNAPNSVVSRNAGCWSELERDEAGHVVGDILAHGGTAEAFAADITDEAAAAGLVSRATGRLGSIDVLVVNATAPQPVVPLVERGVRRGGGGWPSSRRPPRE